MDRRQQAFLAIARSGSLTAAARALHVTQPALTKTLRQLEREMGARLFERTPRGMTLTSAGRVLFKAAADMEFAWRSAREELSVMSRGHLDVLRIGAGPAYHPEIVPRVIGTLSKEFPNTHIEMEAGVNDSELPRLIDGSIDVMLGAIDLQAGSGIEAYPLMATETQIFARVGHPLARFDAVQPEGLSSASWVVYKKDSMVHDRIAAWLAARGHPSPRIAIEVGALMSGFNILRHTDLLMSAPGHLEAIAAQCKLAPLRLDEPVWKFTSGAMIRASMRRLPVVKRCLELLTEETAALDSGPVPATETRSCVDAGG
jgi:DNA-binding transcriptional LysR family regulator